MPIEKKETYKTVAFFVFAFVVFTGGYLAVKNMLHLADEYCHHMQIMEILEGKNFFPSRCPYLPGYHWSTAILSWLIRSDHGDSIRFLSTALSFLCVLAFFMLAKKIDARSSIQKSLLFLLSPVFFPFFFVIYTDIYAMFYVFLALGAALNQRLWLSGIFGILSLMVRQNNIIWLAFIGWLAYFQNYYPQYRWQDIKRWMPKFFFFFLAAALMIAFVIWNKGFILGDRKYHYVTFNGGNIFLALFIFFFLFLPLNLSNFFKIISHLKRSIMLWLILIEITMIYFFFFQSTHYYNGFARFLHNWFIFWMTSPSILVKAAAFIPIVYSVLSLCVTPLQRKSYYLLYPFSILFLLPLPVIEIRYLFIPLAFFILFKQKDPENITLFTLATYIVPNICVIYLILHGTFFP